jgi:gluconolactonase
MFGGTMQAQTVSLEGASTWAPARDDFPEGRAVNLLFKAPQIIPTRVFARLPDELRQHADSEWGLANRPGLPTDSFLEGPAFDAKGRLYVVDIPFGRILRILPGGRWETVISYDGWPNGLKVLPQGDLLVADYRRGLVRIDPHAGTVTPVLARRQSESFKGLNDLCVARDGRVYFTDQGQTGMHDPTGRVFRFTPGVDGHPARLDCLLSNVPSPNGLVLDASERVLFVAATRANSVWRVPLTEDGGVTKVGVFCTLFGAGGPDGLAMDAKGRLYVAHVSLGHVFIYSPQGELTHAMKSCEGAAVTNLAIHDGMAWITESQSGSVLVAPIPD